MRQPLSVEDDGTVPSPSTEAEGEDFKTSDSELDVPQRSLLLTALFAGS